MDIARAIKAVVELEFTQAAETFNNHPMGDHWGRLLDAMWARQAIAHPELLERAVKELEDVGIGYWVKRLREMHDPERRHATPPTKRAYSPATKELS